MGYMKEKEGDARELVAQTTFLLGLPTDYRRVVPLFA